VLPIESVCEISLMRVQIIEDHIRIGGTACREDHDLCESAKLPNELQAMRSHPDAGLNE
jgi:hypothetical protein